MKGVIVLAEHAVYTENIGLTFIAAFFIAIGIMSFLFGVWSVWTGVLDGSIGLVLFGIFSFIMAFLFGGIGATLENKMQESKTIEYIEQKVILEDTVQINDFLKYYEILNQDGKIYIVKEKTKESGNE